MRHADSGEFFRARDELWACANQLRQNRGKDEVAAFVRRVLNACRQMLSTARRSLASHAAGEAAHLAVDKEGNCKRPVSGAPLSTAIAGV